MSLNFNIFNLLSIYNSISDFNISSTATRLAISYRQVPPPSSDETAAIHFALLLPPAESLAWSLPCCRSSATPCTTITHCECHMVTNLAMVHRLMWSREREREQLPLGTSNRPLLYVKIKRVPNGHHIHTKTPLNYMISLFQPTPGCSNPAEVPENDWRGSHTSRP